uniref:pyridoxamine 5'-phosphate oxidase family protein n=1 Tax=Streptomyces akebiae TaxID=2865673 RepID=UPI002175BBC7|nr:pyridoxamine 5'-phosphate oxidase family protein [Streptomyces akebiae]
MTGEEQVGRAAGRRQGPRTAGRPVSDQSYLPGGRTAHHHRRSAGPRHRSAAWPEPALPHPQLWTFAPTNAAPGFPRTGVGRVAVSTPRGPAVVPVNYEVVDDAIAFRTAPDSVPAAAVGA